MSDKIEKMTDDDFKKIMRQLGMPDSMSLYAALKQVENHTWQAARTVPEGFVMVPVEPTQEMLKAGERGIGVSSYVRKGMTIREYRFFKSGWDAMLAAAPEGKK